MALHIRDERAAQLARQLADRKKITMTQAVVDALESALAREGRPLWDRIAEIAHELHRSGDPAHGRPVSKDEIDALWGHE